MTQIISIGLPKTGTRSLMAALATLGYTHTGDAFNRERLARWCAGKYTLNPGYDVQDEPAFAWWRELAEANPDAKLIMTWRAFPGWYRSCGGLVTPHRMELARSERIAHEAVNGVNTTPTLAQAWLFGLVWGGWSYDEREHLALWNRHVLEVMDYGLANLGRVLMLNVCEPNGYTWESLCAFLGCPMPAGEFPWENKS